MKQEPKHNSILHAFFAGSMVLATMGIFSACGYGAVTGPLEVKPGTLATFVSDVEGDCVIYPIGKCSFAKDSGGKSLYFASPITGEYTLIWFGMRDGKPEISTFVFFVGTPEPEPEPNPEPNPEPVVKLTDAEKGAAKSAFQTVLDGIEAKTIRSPQGARAAFKNALIREIGTCTPNGCTLPIGLSNALKTWETGMDITTLEGIRKGFATAMEGLK